MISQEIATSTPKERVLTITARPFLKASVKASRNRIRTAKEAVKKQQREASPNSPRAMAALDRLRKEARAQNLIYGALLGRTWAEMEQNHQKGDPSIKYYLDRIFQEISPFFEELNLTVLLPEAK